MKLKVLLNVAILWVAIPIQAGIDVRVVDFPQRVSMYGPIVITAEVTNSGSGPVLVPFSTQSESRHFVQFGSTVESLSNVAGPSGLGGGSATWLEPGQSRLFQTEIGQFWVFEPGEVLVRAGLRSTGKCQYQATGNERFPLELVHKTSFHTWYKCWKGESLSEIVTIDIVEPNTALDREALEYFESDEFRSAHGSNPRLGMWSGMEDLLERYPQGAITYAVGSRACARSPNCLEQLLELQPSHPLEGHMRTQLALALLRSGRGAEVTESSVEDLPPALGQFIMQQKPALERQFQRIREKRRESDSR